MEKEMPYTKKYKAFLLSNNPLTISISSTQLVISKQTNHNEEDIFMPNCNVLHRLNCAGATKKIKSGSGDGN